MNCKHCGEPISLIPSAAARAAKDTDKSHTAEWYTKLFEYHSQCTLEMRVVATQELMQRLKGNKA